MGACYETRRILRVGSGKMGNGIYVTQIQGGSGSTRESAEISWEWSKGTGKRRGKTPQCVHNDANDKDA